MTTITPRTRRVAGLTLVISGLLSVLGVVVLPATGWPASVQGMSFADALPLVADNRTAFRVGYGAFVVAGLLFLPAALHLTRVLGDDGRTTSTVRLIAALALVSAALRTLWYGATLTIVPVLERLWRGGDAVTQAAVEVFYVAVHDLLSTVQEDIGVNLFGGFFTVLASVLIVRSRRFPRWLGVMGLLAGISYIISSSELIGVPTGGIVPILGPALSSLWFIGLGVVELVRASRSSAALPDSPAMAPAA